MKSERNKMNYKKRIENAEMKAKEIIDQLKETREFFKNWQEPIVKNHPEAGKMSSKVNSFMPPSASLFWRH
jgi:hypothetical protein